MVKCDVKVIEGGKLPVKQHYEDACFDMFAREIEFITSTLVKVKLGVALQPELGWRVALYPRSSVSKTGWMLANGVGVGDRGYTGEYCAYFNLVQPQDKELVQRNENQLIFKDKYPFPYKEGDRCLQMELVPYNYVVLNEVKELQPTSRGEGGFGSTGK